MNKAKKAIKSPSLCKVSLTNDQYGAKPIKIEKYIPIFLFMPKVDTLNIQYE
jgi:hypothetical protein